MVGSLLLYKPSGNYTYQLPRPQILDGSFSSVSTPIFTAHYYFFSILIFFKIYTFYIKEKRSTRIYTPSHRSKLKILRTFRRFFHKYPATSFLSNSVLLASIFTDNSRIFVNCIQLQGESEICTWSSRDLWEILRNVRNLLRNVSSSFTSKL